MWSWLWKLSDIFTWDSQFSSLLIRTLIFGCSSTIQIRLSLKRNQFLAELIIVKWLHFLTLNSISSVVVYLYSCLVLLEVLGIFVSSLINLASSANRIGDALSIVLACR